MCTSLALKIEAAVIGSSNRRVKILEGRRNDMQPVHIRETAMVTRRAARAEHLVVATASVVLDVLRDSAVVKSGLKKKKKKGSYVVRRVGWAVELCFPSLEMANNIDG